MAFPSDTYIRVLKALVWHTNQASEVKLALSNASDDVDLETAILDTLTNLEGVKTRFAAIRAGDNAGLVKADVLEWDRTNRVEDFHDQLNALQQELANLLGLTWGWSRQTQSNSLEITTW